MPRSPASTLRPICSTPPRRDHAGIDFVKGDIATWNPAEPCDLVFSNAALQWVGDHERLMPRLLGR